MPPLLAAQCTLGLRILPRHIGKTWGPHTGLQTWGFSIVSMSGPKSYVQGVMKYALLLTGVTGRGEQVVP